MEITINRKLYAFKRSFISHDLFLEQEIMICFR